MYQEKWTEEHRVYEYLSKEVKVDAEVDVQDVPPQPKKEMGATQKGKILISWDMQHLCRHSWHYGLFKCTSFLIHHTQYLFT